MKLWLLRQVGDECGVHGQIWQMIIRAETEEMARKVCGNFYLKEGLDTWHDPTKSTCQELVVDGERDALFTDYRDGC